MPTIEELGQKVKGKYPGVYDDISDTDLGVKVKAKYPGAYDDFVSVQPPPQAPQPTPPTRLPSQVPGTTTEGERAQKLSQLSGAVSSVFPGGEIGRALGTSVQGIGESIKQRSFKPLLQAGAENNKRFGQFAGDVVQSVVLPASLAINPAKTIVGKAAQFGGLSAVSGAASSLAKGGDTKEAAKSAFYAGLTGAALGATVGIVGKGVEKALSKSPESLYNNSLKVTQKIKNAGKSPSSFLNAEGTWGSLGSIKRAAQSGMSAEESVIRQAASNVPGGTTYADIKVKALESLSKSSLGDLYSKAQLEQLIDDVPLSRIKDSPDVVNWVDVDGVRSSLGSLIGDSKWLQSTPAPQTKAAQAVYGVLSDAVKEATGTSQNFYRLSQWIRTNKVVDRAIGLADNKYGLGLYDVISGTGGAVVGGLTGEGDFSTRLKNAAIGGAVGLGLERGLNSTFLKTGAAQLLTQINSLPVDSVGRISKAALIQLIGQATKQSPEKQTPQ